jgi:drug/metabolite transporter (DMT)-like permease
MRYLAAAHVGQRGASTVTTGARGRATARIGGQAGAAGGVPRAAAGQAIWIAALAVLAVVWGGSVPATKLGLAAFPPLTLTTLRYVAAAPAFGLLLIGRRRPPPRALFAMAALGIVGIGGGQLLQSLAISQTTASAATVISAFIPMLVVVLAALRLKQSLRARHVAGLAAAFLGVLLVAVGDPRNLGAVVATSAFAGDILMLGCSFLVAFYYVFSAELVARYGAIVVAGWTSLAGAVAMLPLMAAELRLEPVHPSLLGLGCVLYLALLVTVGGIWLWLQAMAHVPARVAASMQYLQPLVGVGLSALLFGEPLDAWFIAGTACVLLGILLSTVTPRGRAEGARRRRS